MKSLRTVGVVVGLVLWGLGGLARAESTGEYLFDLPDQYTADFTDLRRGADINDSGALDLGGTGFTALNLTGGAGPAGDFWLTKWTPDGALVGFGDACGVVSVEASVLIHTYNNAKGAGVVTLLNHTEPGDKGLALIVYDNGNSDALQLVTVDVPNGKLAKLATIGLKAAIKEDAWYHLQLLTTTTGSGIGIIGTVWSLSDPKDPESPLAAVVGQLQYEAERFTIGIGTIGQVGIIASAVSTSVNSSVTKWQATEPCGCFAASGAAPGEVVLECI